MWKRRTRHECADELASVSERFQAALWGRLYGNGTGWPRNPKDEDALQDESKKGVEILRILTIGPRR